jgi:hypothetical protein
MLGAQTKSVSLCARLGHPMVIFLGPTLQKTLINVMKVRVILNTINNVVVSHEQEEPPNTGIVFAALHCLWYMTI